MDLGFTRRNLFVAPDMRQIAKLVDEALTHRQNPAAPEVVARKVAVLAERFPLYPELRG